MKFKLFFPAFIVLFLAFGFFNQLGAAGDTQLLEHQTFGELFEAIVNVIFYIAIIVCPLGIVAGGVMMIFAGANPGSIEQGKKIILYSTVILGIIVIIKAMASFFAPDLTL